MSRRALSSPPRMLPLYAKAAAGALPGGGMLPFLGRRGGEIPDLELELPELAVDRDHLGGYCKVCGFAMRDALPGTYPHVLAFPLHLALLTDPGFPLPAVGLIHIENRIVQHRPIGLGERLALRVRATKLEPHPRGRKFSLLTEARVDDQVVWEEASTELRRGAGSGERPPSERSTPAAEDLPAAARWRLPGDLGRRYAAVSGDRNPVHLYGLTAKPFGFARAIAHGMWTKARCLAAMEPRLPGAYAAEARFRRPILLPAEVTFAVAEEEEGRIAFGVRDDRERTPHLDGSVVTDAAHA